MFDFLTCFGLSRRILQRFFDSLPPGVLQKSFPFLILSYRLDKGLEVSVGPYNLPSELLVEMMGAGKVHFPGRATVSHQVNPVRRNISLPATSRSVYKYYLSLYSILCELDETFHTSDRKSTAS